MRAFPVFMETGYNIKELYRAGLDVRILAVMNLPGVMPPNNACHKVGSDSLKLYGERCLRISKEQHTEYVSRWRQVTIY
jgi:hypothetical protein